MGHCNHVLVEVADSALRRLLVSLMCIPYRDGKTMFVVSPGGAEQKGVNSKMTARAN